MTTNTAENNWLELKGKIKTKWAKISDEDIETVRADLDLLAARIQATYGIAQEYADRQYAVFKQSVQSLLEAKSE